MINVNLSLTPQKAKALWHLMNFGERNILPAIKANGYSHKEAAEEVLKDADLYGPWSALDAALKSAGIDPRSVESKVLYLDGYDIKVVSGGVNIQGYFVSDDELKAIHKFVTDGKQVEDFYVAVSPATSKVLQQVAFNAGWTWKSGRNVVEDTHFNYIRFNAKGYIAATDRPKNESRKSFEAAVVYANAGKTTNPTAAGHLVNLNNNGTISAGCVTVSLATLVKVMQARNLL